MHPDGRVFTVAIKKGKTPQIIQLKQPTLSLDLKNKAEPIDYVVSEQLKRWLRTFYFSSEGR